VSPNMKQKLKFEEKFLRTEHIWNQIVFAALWFCLLGTLWTFSPQIDG